MDNKIIVSNRAALTGKYGRAGVAKIKAAIASLAAADAKRTVKTRLVFLDDAGAMRRFKAKPVADAGDPRENKEAIDAIFRAANPHYLMILGADDVVPHQDLRNPMFKPPDDPDRFAYGDLPYACDAPYSQDIATFKGPTRVVARLPDLRGAKEPSYLIKVLAVARDYRCMPVEEYGDAYFGLTTASWKKSTTLSLFNVFGNANAVVVSPPEGPRHAAKTLAPLMHFINCHGGSADPSFYGEATGRNPPQPPSLTSGTIKGRIKPGTVAAVECCYGAQLYDSVTLSLPLPICQHYLLQGAYGYFGSTTIAYGPEDGNGAADYIAQYFLASILEGASIGRAALVARQRFIEQVSELDPADLKTLGQFNVLGDPSVHPAKVESATGVPKGVDAAETVTVQREARRAKLRAAGEFLEQTKPAVSSKPKAGPKAPTVNKALANIARAAGLEKGSTFRSYDVKLPPGVNAPMAKAARIASRYYVATSAPRGRKGVLPYNVTAIAKEVDNRIVAYRVYIGK